MSLKINLIADKSNKRAKLFLELFKLNNDTYEVKGITNKIDSEADYNIFFGFKDTKKIKDFELEFSVDKKFKFIFDVDNIFNTKESLKNKDNDPFIVLILCSDHVICENMKVQELLYHYTGRLCSIVHTPYEVVERIPKCIRNKQLLWYGDITDIFSLNKYRQADYLDLAFSSLLRSDVPFFHNRKKFQYYKGPKKKRSILDKYDVIFLPKTATEEAEMRRVEKVKECLGLGKLVIAPDLLHDKDEHFCSLGENMDLEDFLKTSKPGKLQSIREKSFNHFKEINNKTTIANQLFSSLKNADDDMFLTYLDNNNDNNKVTQN